MAYVEQLIECEPKFSEGRNLEIVSAIADAIRKTPGCSLQYCNLATATNRSICNFIGSPDDVVKGALAAARIAYYLIDMSDHKGGYPRMGALDVCPFVPVKNTTVDDCVQCANDFGKLLSQELNVPVYLYGFAAREEKRKLLKSIRAGEYEDLPRKLEDPEWVPDYGPATFVPSWGASMIGASEFLITFNVNLFCTEEQIYRIVSDLREQSGREQGSSNRYIVQGIGWYMGKPDIVYIWTEITDYAVTTLHSVYENAKKCVEKLNLHVTGSEIVGRVPLDFLLQAAKFYMEKEEILFLEEKEKVRLAIDRLGLNSLNRFDPDKKIVEYCARDDARDFPLGSMSLKKFISAIGSRTPAPGGGSVSAAVAAMGAALGSMAGLMTYGNCQCESLDTVMRQNIPPVHDAMQELTPLIDKDSNAFDGYMAALELPKKTEDEKKFRQQAMQNGLVEAIRVPQSLIATINKCWPCLIVLAENCNIIYATDIQVGVKCLETGAWGAHQNVLFNLKLIMDDVLRDKLRNETEKALDITMSNCKRALDILQAKLHKNRIKQVTQI